MANVLLGVTGSVAAIRTPALAAALAASHQVKVVATKSAEYFFDAKELPAGTLVRDADEWPGERFQRDDPVLHIELRKWADVLVVAPLDANTLAKFALGLCDNCLACVWRAWDLEKPILLAPAMNTLMWQHPATARHVSQISRDVGLIGFASSVIDSLVKQINQQRGSMRIIGPIEKALACGDMGQGGMSEVPEIVAAVNEMLSPTSGNP